MTKGIAPVVGGRVKYAGGLRVALDGRVNDAERVLVACGGFAREVWPPDGLNTDPIQPSTDALYVRDIRLDGDTATAIISYVNSGGNLEYTYTEVPLEDGVESLLLENVFTPPPYAPDLALIRMETLTGTITGPTGWQDALDEPAWYVEETTVQDVNIASGTLSIAEDDGGGSPVPGTTVSRTVYFHAEIIGSDDNPGFQFTQNPWSLSDITSEEEAGVAIRIFRPPLGAEGFVWGFEGLPFTDGTQTHDEYYAQPPDGGEELRLVAVSGDTAEITGPTLGDWITLQWATGVYKRTWELRAPDEGDSYTAVVDLEVNDGYGGIVAKRITLHAERLTDQTGPDTDINLDPGGYVIQDSPGFAEAPAQVTVQANSDGTFRVFGLNAGEAPGSPGEWNSSAPAVTDPQNFLVRLRPNGTFPTGQGNSPVNTWVPLSTSRAWQFGTNVLGGGGGSFEWSVDFKVVGTADGTAQTITVTGSAVSEAPGPIE